MSTPGRCALVLAIVVLLGLTSAQMDGAGQDDLRAGQNDRLESQEPAEAPALAFPSLEIAPAARTFPNLEIAPASRTFPHLEAAPDSRTLTSLWSSDDESDAAGAVDRSLSNHSSLSNLSHNSFPSNHSNMNRAPRVNANPEIEIDNTMSRDQIAHLGICMDGGCVRNGVYRTGCPVFALWRSKNGRDKIMQPGCIIESREKEKGPIEFMIQWLDGDTPQLVNREDVYFRDETTMYPYTNFNGSGPVYYDNVDVVPVPSAATSRGLGGSASRGLGGSAPRGLGGSTSHSLGGSAPRGLGGSASHSLGESARLGLGGSARLGLGGSARQGLGWSESQSLGGSGGLGIRQGSESQSLGGSGGLGLRQGSAFSAPLALGGSAPRALGCSAPQVLGGSARQQTLAKSETSDQVRQRNLRHALRGTIASSSLSAGVDTGAASGGSAARGSLSSTGAQAMSMPITTIVISNSSEGEAEPALQDSAQTAESGDYQQEYCDFMQYHSTRRSNRNEFPPPP